MCQIFSCIATRDGRIYSQKDNPSHTTIALENNLPENGKDEMYRAKIEVVPRRGYSYKDAPSPETWEVIIDEEARPDWCNDRTDRNAMAAALKWWKSRVIPDGASVTVESGFWIVLAGSPTITQSGGEVYTYDSSSPTITQSGGEVYTYDSSSPTITQSGGEVCTRDSSSPTITRVEPA